MKNLIIIFLIGLSLVILGQLLQSPPHRFEGKVISVSYWDGDAELKTQINNRDTIIIVKARRNEKFVVGQILTAWTGGDCISNATTYPQE